MKHTDIHDARKAQIEDNAIRRAELEHEEKVAMFGKAAYEQYAKEAAKIRVPAYEWSELVPDSQCRWVRIAQAVLDEARLAGWFK